MKFNQIFSVFDPLVAQETLWFCMRHKLALLNHTNVFSLYFHAFLKISAWFPYETLTELEELLPTFVGPNTYLELFHSLLDLPLLAAALERVAVGRGKLNDRLQF